MNPIAIGLTGGVMRTVETDFRRYVRDMAKRGIKVSLIREGESIIVKREVPEAKRRAAFDALLERLRKAKPARPGSVTATALVRELRDSGRY